MDFNTVRNITALPPETLANILSFLPARSLVNSLPVCRLWKDLVERELTKRKYFVSRVFKCCKDGLNLQIDDIRKQIIKFLNDINIVPSAMVMSCYGMSDSMELADFGRKLLFKIRANLPKDCIIIGARKAGGIIGETNSGCSVVRNYSEMAEQLSVLFIPKVKNVNVNHFQVKIKEIKDNEKKWRTKLDHLVDKNIKFLFLIGTETLGKNLNNMLSKTVKILGKQITVGGGLAKPFAVVDNKLLSTSITGLAIGGDIEASNIVENDLDIKQSLQKMQILNESSVLHPTACFLIPCVSLLFPDIVKETSEVRKTFPHLKIFGFLGFGEIGTVSCKDNKELLDILHFYSISLSILKFL